MNIIKNILLVSHLKNKGIRRICFVASVCILLYLLFSSFTNFGYRGVDKRYNNFHELNEDIHLSWIFKSEYYYRKVDCAAIYLKKYGFSKLDAYALTSNKDIADENSQWCFAFDTLCKNIREVKNNPIHLKCGMFETYEHSNGVGFLIFISLFVFALYLPFIACVLLKLAFKFLKAIVVWIYKGFKAQ